MKKLRMTSSDATAKNTDFIAGRFPHCIVEAKDGKGNIVRAVDFDLLRQELSKEEVVVAGDQERYVMNWPDKKKAILTANSPIAKTLRPFPAESVNYDTTQNLYIEGDNLDVLKLLRETYLKKVDVIYIDPPYNTGRNLIYKNNFYKSADDYLEISEQVDEDQNRLVVNTETNGRFHTDWLNMMYPRLKVARDLLSENGIIVITIDDCEIDNTIKLMNEIFGADRHLATIVVKNNPSGRSTVTGAAIAHEYAIFYGGSNEVTLGRLPRNEKQLGRYKENDGLGPFEWVNFRARYSYVAPTMQYSLFVKKDGSDFRVPKMEYNEKAKKFTLLEQPSESESILYPVDEAGLMRSWKWSIDTLLKNKETETAVRLDRSKTPSVYVKARMNEGGMLPLTVWDDTKYSSTEYGNNLLVDLMGGKYFDYPKSLYAVEDSLRIASKTKNALILDFFSGSSTTAHAVMQLNAEDGGTRKFIMVQLPETADEKSEAFKAGFKTIPDIAKERIRRAGKKIADLNRMTAPNLDVGFRVLKLDSTNMKDVYYNPSEYSQSLLDEIEQNIKHDRSPEDLLFQVMLEMGITLDAKIEAKTIAGKKIFTVNDDALIACFDAGLTDEVVTEIAKMKPLYAAFRDSGIKKGSVGVNFDQIFKAYHPTMKKEDRKVL